MARSKNIVIYGFFHCKRTYKLATILNSMGIKYTPIAVENCKIKIALLEQITAEKFKSPTIVLQNGTILIQPNIKTINKHLKKNSQL